MLVKIFLFWMLLTKPIFVRKVWTTIYRMPIRYHYTMSKLKFIRKNQNLYSDSTLYRAKKMYNFSLDSVVIQLFLWKHDINKLTGNYASKCNYYVILWYYTLSFDWQIWSPNCMTSDTRQFLGLNLLTATSI